jgi:hypothetical protein
VQDFLRFLIDPRVLLALGVVLFGGIVFVDGLSQDREDKKPPPAEPISHSDDRDE